MILRKPYAFLIRHFRLIHVILMIFVGFLIWKSAGILSFFSEYMSSGQANVAVDLTSELFNIWMFLFPWIIIVINLIIIGLLYNKKKPILFYTINIIIAIAILVIYNITYNNIEILESELLDLKTIRMIRDLVFSLFVAQCISEVIVIVRATGFDIKKFDFGNDLAELEINETDNEEFEFSINIDTDRLNRRRRRTQRYARYIYIENKFLIDIIVLIGIATTCFIVYTNVSIYNKTIEQKTAFSTNDFNIMINKSYVTDTDYKGKVMTNGKALVVLEISVKARFKEQQLPTVLNQLVINDKKYYPIITYRDQVFDLGPTYQDEKISTKFEKYLLVYEIPHDQMKEEMLYMFENLDELLTTSTERKYIKVNLKPQNLEANKETSQQQIGNAINFEGSILQNTILVINSYAIQKEFKETYKFCATTTECYDSYEYVRPNIVNTYPKVLLKLDTSLTLDENLITEGLYNPYAFINYFGKIKYTLNGEEKIQNINFSRVQPVKAKKENIYYIEIQEEIINAEKVSLMLHIRNKDYEYVLK